MHCRCECQLPNIIRAICPSPSFSYRLNTGKQDRNKHTDNANNYQQLNNGKAVPCDYYFHLLSIFLMNKRNHFKISTMGRKGLHCTDSTNFYTESTFKTYFTFCAEARNRQLFGFDSRTLRNMLILQPPHPFQYSSLLASIWNTGQNTRSQKLPGIFVLRGFLFCTAALRSCPTK